MSTAERIKEALAPLGYPVAQLEHVGTEETYFVFTLGEIPANHADDEPQHLRITVMLHLFCPIKLNTWKLKRKVKAALQEAAFTYPEETDASEVGKQHVVFEFEGVEAATDGL